MDGFCYMRTWVIVKMFCAVLMGEGVGARCVFYDASRAFSGGTYSVPIE